MGYEKDRRQRQDEEEQKRAEEADAERGFPLPSRRFEDDDS